MDDAKELRLKGAAVSEGVAIGNLFFLPSTPNETIPEYAIDGEKAEVEVIRYRRAVSASRDELLFLKFSLEKEGSKEALEVIEAHVQMLEDPLITTQVDELIRGLKKNAESIFSQVIREYERKFAKIKDPYFQQRIVDILDLSKRILGHLLDRPKFDFSKIPQNSILVAQELSPSHTAAMQISRVAAFITQHGGGSSHAALIARAKGIPYICNVDLEHLRGKDSVSVVVDGELGEVIVSPILATLKRYSDIKRQIQTSDELLAQAEAMQVETADGYPVHVYANVGSMDDLEEMRMHHPEGVGLFRSEYFFLGKDIAFLTEEEQMSAYSAVLAQLNSLSLVFRVLDVGGDKNPDGFLENRREANPVLGCRGIRFLLRHPAIFRKQLRAIMRVSQNHDVRILLPLVSDIQELQDAKKLIAEVQEELIAQGVSSPKTFPIGCMIEVPSLVFLIDAVVKEVDFLSIGTNDLIQYTLGVDRSNPAVSEFFYPGHPSIIRMIKAIVTEAKKYNKPVAICGEIASDPTFVPLLLGLGVSEFSCSPRYISLIKRTARQCSLLDTFKLAQRILQMSSSSEISALLQEIHKQLPLE